ncbi:MAG: molybdenum cofactor guanylyltransferase, partial [Erysipelotrichia bacterium]|nr:molybdenum cofactor guanylyltransferase [Erysipelotrichia bacterium]
KTLLPFFNSNSLAQFQYDRLKLHFQNIYISSKTNKFNFINEKNLILDENKEIFSPILALDTIFKKINNQKIFIITVDSPFVTIESIKELIKNSVDVDVCVAKTEDKVHNLCGVFDSNISITIQSMLRDDIHKINYLIKQNKFKIIEFINHNEFMNINNPEDYKKSLSYINKIYNSN